MKKFDDIERIISDNLRELNEIEPPAGHFERFQNKLKNSGKKREITLGVVWKIAAAAIFTFLAVNQSVIWFFPENEKQANLQENNEMSLSYVSPEYEEVEFYYTNAISTGIKQWEKMAAEGFISEEDQKMMDTELREFEKVYGKLQNDLSTSPNDERVINAMLDYYRTKLSLINMIISKLKEVKQKNNNYNEKEY